MLETAKTKTATEPTMTALDLQWDEIRTAAEY